MSIWKCLLPGAALTRGLLAYPNAASAQSYGEIRGTVTDVSGAVVNGAALTVTGVANNQVRRAVTNETGSYAAQFLVPGKARDYAIVQRDRFGAAERPRFASEQLRWHNGRTGAF
jgi:hypothetical protein